MQTYRIGRSGDNDVVIGDRSVSRRHAELRVEHGRYQLIDLGSTNGTYVRDGKDWAKIDQAFVSADERIMLGDTVTTVTALLAGTAGGAGPDASIRGGPRQMERIGDQEDPAPAGAARRLAHEEQVLERVPAAVLEPHRPAFDAASCESGQSAVTAVFRPPPPAGLGVPVGPRRRFWAR